MKSLWLRTFVYGGLLVGCFLAIWPPCAREGQPGRIPLGLDLRGGTHLVLQVRNPSAGPVSPALLNEVIHALERRVNQLGVADPVITGYGRSGDQVLVQLPGVKDVAQAKRVLVSVAQLSLQIVEKRETDRKDLLQGFPHGLPADLEIVEGAPHGPPDLYLLRREALLTGRDLRTARVWVTILDTHVTALIAAAFLFQFGTGPLKGFAVTLVMGLVANVFASYFVSKLLFEWVLGRGEGPRLSI